MEGPFRVVGGIRPLAHIPAVPRHARLAPSPSGLLDMTSKVCNDTVDIAASDFYCFFCSPPRTDTHQEAFQEGLLIAILHRFIFSQGFDHHYSMGYEELTHVLAYIDWRAGLPSDASTIYYYTCSRLNAGC